ncbi:hypothetical protein D3C78_1480330 [compost metagenome]
MAGVLRVQALAALEDALALAHGHAGAVVFHPQFAIAIAHPGADADVPEAEAEGVLQQVAENLQQGALLHRHHQARVEVPLHPYRLLPVDLVQGVAERVQQGRQLHLVAHQAALAQGRALQLVADLLAHALDLAA